ncbi:MAG: DUF1499 domain-containing protein [Planctomycetota bacterium]|nr:DUF1499 domain-containing protein [Planctomycetota bacterium]MDA1212090.1 DUF1499 domain-containing protein [Planctomycetota bacterium]
MSIRVYAWGLAAAALVGLTIIVVLLLLAKWSRRPQPLRRIPTSHRLADCSPSPNCVCSQATRDAQTIAPFAVSGDVATAMQKMIGIIESLPQATITTRDKTYLHVEFRSTVFGFVDDVEFLADPSIPVIHVRSASRVGYSDGGANRQRIDRLRKLYESSP